MFFMTNNKSARASELSLVTVAVLKVVVAAEVFFFRHVFAWRSGRKPA
jgi:hypothetical protein